MDRKAMPFTPKQLVAALPVILVNTASLMLISPFVVCNFIMKNILSAELDFYRLRGSDMQSDYYIPFFPE